MPDRPNLLVIVSDQHNPHVLGCAGDRVVRTPNLDALAARGVRFASNYCNAPLCVPSRMSFMTGQQCSQIEVWTNGCYLGSDVPTFAHALGAAGYETVLCGRMHFVGPDQRHGFQSRPIGDVLGSFPGGTYMPDLGSIPLSTTGQSYEATAVSGPGRTAYQAYDEDVTRTCCEWLAERSRSADDAPWCVVVGYVLPHCPYICPKPLYDYYHDRVDVPTVPAGYVDGLHPAVRAWREQRGVDRLTVEQARGARAAYYGLVEYHDRLVGRVLESLAATRFGPTTAVVCMSDHGDMAGEHGMWWKTNMYEGSVGVPMIWSWPGAFAQGREVSAVTSLVDLAPTLTELGGAQALPDAAGHSLVGFLRADEGTVPDWPDTAYSEIISGRPVRMVRRGPWKLNHYHGYDRPQLLNLADDPGEFVDRADDASCAPVRDELQALALADWDPEWVEQTIARRRTDHELLSRWASADPPADPDYWSAPPGANVFPGS